MYEDRLGVRTVDIAKLKKEGNKLFYEKDGRWVPIERIYNRAIVDEVERKGVVPAFDYRDELEVEWAGHPNWYFRISKFSLPYLQHESVPTAVFLDDWFAGRGRERLPEDREQVLLKPLYSFAGKGIQFAPTDAELAAIPEADRHLYLLQERVRFEPVIRDAVWDDAGGDPDYVSVAGGTGGDGAGAEPGSAGTWADDGSGSQPESGVDWRVWGVLSG